MIIPAWALRKILWPLRLLADGTTIIENVAKEPEIVDLANFLNKMGAKVKGAGTDLIKIEGVERFHGTKHIVIPDRIETGTFMVAAAITRGDLLIKNVVPDHVRPIISKLIECGCTVEDTIEGLRVKADEKDLVATDNKDAAVSGISYGPGSPSLWRFLLRWKGEVP